MKNVLKIIAENTKLYEGEKGVRAFVEFIGKNPGASLEDAAIALRIPIPVLAAVRREAEKLKVLDRMNGLQLSNETLSTFPSAVTLEVSKLKEEFNDTIASLYSSRPTYKPELDQAHATPETSFNRAIEVLSVLPVPKSILIVGDDDLVSISLGWLSKQTGIDLSITVLEHDIRLVDFIRDLSSELNLNIAVIETNVKDSLPENIAGAFDVFVTDPPYTITGLQKFLEAGVYGLSKEVGNKVLLSFPSLPPAEQLEFYSILQKLRLAVREIKPRFNKYIGATIYGNTTDLFTLEYVPSELTSRNHKGFYTFERLVK